jgi:DNA-binding transcriptional MerR regulator
MAAVQNPTTTLTLVRRNAARGPLVSIETLARDAGVHPEVVLRLVRLGLFDPAGGTAAAPLFGRDDAASLARAIRLRRDLGLSYAGALLACELLARIDVLERRLRRYEP